MTEKDKNKNVAVPQVNQKPKVIKTPAERQFSEYTGVIGDSKDFQLKAKGVHVPVDSSKKTNTEK